MSNYFTSTAAHVPFPFNAQTPHYIPDQVHAKFRSLVVLTYTSDEAMDVIGAAADNYAEALSDWLPMTWLQVRRRMAAWADLEHGLSAGQLFSIAPSAWLAYATKIPTRAICVNDANGPELWRSVPRSCHSWLRTGAHVWTVELDGERYQVIYNAEYATGAVIVGGAGYEFEMVDRDMLAFVTTPPELPTVCTLELREV